MLKGTKVDWFQKDLIKNFDNDGTFAPVKKKKKLIATKYQEMKTKYIIGKRRLIDLNKLKNHGVENRKYL